MLKENPNGSQWPLFICIANAVGVFLYGLTIP